MKRTIAVLAATIALAIPASAQWGPARGGYVPNASLPAGYETNGQPCTSAASTSISETDRRSASARFAQVSAVATTDGQVANARNTNTRSCARHNRLGMGNRQRRRSPRLRGGRRSRTERRPLFVCRAQYRGGLQLGKVRRAFRGCNIIYGGKEFPAYW